jgi:hypothetical protein
MEEDFCWLENPKKKEILDMSKKENQGREYRRQTRNQLILVLSILIKLSSNKKTFDKMKFL